MSLLYYLGLLDYRERIEAFRRGIEAEVRDGDRVLDLGCGLGTFAFFAARAGAEEVVAVDADPVVHVARSVARQNGLDDGIEFVRGRIPEVELGDPFDVLIFEDFPRRLLDRETHRLLRRVGDELLAPGARVLPRSARLQMAPAREPPREGGDPGEANPEGLRRYGLDFSPLRSYLRNEPQGVSLPRDALLAEPVAGPEVTLVPPPPAEGLGVEGRWSLEPGTRIDALLLWFDLQVASGAWTTNAPGPRSGPWGQLALPLEPPLRVGDDGVVRARTWRDPLPDGAPGWLGWRAESGGAEAGGHEFAAYPASLDDLLPEDGSSPDGPERGGEGGEGGLPRPGRERPSR